MAAERTAAELLQNRLTEYGLVRVLSQQDVNPDIVKELPLEEAARIIQQGFAPRSGKKVKKVKKAKTAKKAVKKSAKKAKKNGGPSKPQPRYWQRVKKELHVLLCTNEKRYEAIRRQIGKEGRTTQMFLATSIATAIGPFIGVASAAVIGPLVTLALIALVRVGTTAWCAGQIDV